MVSHFLANETFQLLLPMSIGREARHPIRVGQFEIGEMRTSGMPVFVCHCILFADIHLGKQRELFRWLVFSIAVSFEIRLQECELFRRCARRLSP
jgi:hypothetical protein